MSMDITSNKCQMLDDIIQQLNYNLMMSNLQQFINFISYMYNIYMHLHGKHLHHVHLWQKQEEWENPTSGNNNTTRCQIQLRWHSNKPELC